MSQWRWARTEDSQPDAGSRNARAEFYYAERDRHGIVGAITARAAAQKLRLSVVYALLDRSLKILPEHVLAAEAVWRYCADSAEYVFGSTIGNELQDRLLKAVREAPNASMTRTQVRDFFQRKRTGNEIDMAVLSLVDLGLVRVETEKTAGRPIEILFAQTGDQRDQCRQKVRHELFGRLRSLMSRE